MASQEDLVISIKADTQKAADSIEKITAQLDELKVALVGTSESVTGFGAAMVKLNATIGTVTAAFEAAHKVYEKTVSAFVEQDDAIRTLSNTLRLVGEKDVAGATKRFQEFADQLKENSTIDDDVVLRYASMAKAIGLTDSQTEKLIQTSADLSAVTGKSLESSFDELLQTYKGVTRGVLEYDKSISALNASQLKQGGAIDKLSEKFQGFAKAQSETVGGQFKQVQVRINDVLKDIGGLFAKFFRLGDQHFALEALGAIDAFVKSMGPTVEKLSDKFAAMFEHLKNGFEAVSDKGDILVGILITVGTAMTVAFGPSVIASILSVATAIGSVVIASAPVAAQLALITTAILAIGAAVEIVIRNFSSLKDVVASLFSGQFSKAKETIANLDFGVAGKSIKGAIDFVKGFNKELDTTAKKVETVNDTTRKAAGSFSYLSEEGKKAIDDLAKKVEELKLKQTQLSENVVNTANQQLAVELKNIDAIQKDLISKDALNEKAKELLKIARDTAKANAQLEIYQKQKKALDELVEKNKDLQLTVDSANKTQVEIIDLQVKRAIEVIEKKKEELRLQGLLTDKVEATLDAQEALTKQGGELAKQKAPSQTFESLQMGGDLIGKGITDAFAPILGAVSGIGAVVSAADAVVSAIPQMLDQIADLVTKVTELPLKIMESLNKVFASIITYITNIIPNWVKAIRGILNSAIDFLKKIPDAIAKALGEVPDLVLSLLNDLPDIIEKLVSALESATPRIALMFAEFMVKKAPYISLKITEFLAIQLPIAIAKGLLDALKSIGGAISDLFKGKGIKFFDPKDLEQQINNTLKNLSGSASRLFEVKDLTAAAQNAKQFTKAVQEEVDKSILKLKDAWLWVWNHILQPIIDALYKLWNWVNDHIFEPIINAIAKAFQWVLDNIILPLASVVSKAFQWVIDNIINPLANIVMRAFQWVVDNILSPMGNIIAKAFQWVVDNIIGPLSKLGQSAFQWVKDNIIDKFANAGAAIWDGLKSAFDPKFLANMGMTIWNGMKDGLSGLGKILQDTFNAINPANIMQKIFSIPDSAYGQGPVEQALSKLGSKVDIPYVKFARGGMVPGQASVRGNSEINDKILALVSPGEAFIDREKMENPVIKYLVNLILSGKLNPPKFAFGGSVGGVIGKVVDGDVGGAIKDITNTTPEQVIKEIKAGIKTVEDLGKYLNPAELWKMVQDKLGESVMGIFQGNKFAMGGLVGDTVPALMDPREYVMNPGAVRRIGLGRLNAMNQGYSEPQVVNYNIELPITIENNGKDIDAAWVKTNILPTVQKELKRASLEGNFIISTKGIRNA